MHKSHSKRGIKSCRLTNHFLEKDHELVKDKSHKEFDASLVKHVQIILFSSTVIYELKKKEKSCEERKGYWQHHLRTFEKFGGMKT